jgi:hypothetical protein
MLQSLHSVYLPIAMDSVDVSWFILLFVWSMIFNATFNTISVISWRSVILVEETRVPGENHRPIASHWQTLSHNVVLSTPHLSGIRTFLGEELPNYSDEESKEKVSLDTWLKKPDVSFSCKCSAIGSNGYMFPRYMSTHGLLFQWASTTLCINIQLLV